MRIVFMGTPSFSVPVLEGLIENYDVVGVVTQPDRKVGRKQGIVYPPTKELAMKHNIPVFQPQKIREDYEQLLDWNPDIIITCAYGQIIPQAILDIPRMGCINVHASLLPKLRGGAPIHKAIIDGYDKTGITIMYMDASMDTGDMVSWKETEITLEDTLESLHDRLSIMGKELLLETLPSILDGSAKRIPQNHEEATFAYNIKREEEHIDFSKTKKEVFDLVRGLYPIPSANAILFNQEMKIYACKMLEKTYDAPYGEIVEVNKEGIVVSVGDGSILITSLKPFGKKRMDAISYINGVGKEKLIGERFL